jgi:hypothetical protein
MPAAVAGGRPPFPPDGTALEPFVADAPMEELAGEAV